MLILTNNLQDIDIDMDMDMDNFNLHKAKN
jgi:hypothetical protein